MVKRIQWFRDNRLNTWDQRDAAIDASFHSEPDIFFTPLANYVQMPTGVGLNQKWYTGRETIPSHANHNPIGWYARYTDGIYLDTRERALYSRLRYGGKAQWDKTDEIVTRFGNDTDSFISAAMNANLLRNVTVVHEKIARDAVLRFAQNKFIGNLSQWDASHNVNTFDGSGSNKFDIKYLEEMSLRLAIRSGEHKGKFGDYANPVPGEQFRDNVLLAVPTSVYWDLWNSPARDWMVDLRQLSDQRIINGGKVQYRNITIQDYGVSLSLWNAGKIINQMVVSEPIMWGDGTPDPETGAAVDNIWLSGQGGAAVKHYIQLAANSFDANTAPKYGDFVTIHVKRTNEFGVTNGADVLDGQTITVEIVSADVANQRVVVRKPITEQFDKVLGDGSGGYAYMTIAQHVYPCFAIGARGMVTWAGREPITWHRPKDEEADYPSIERVTWQERGEMNMWDPDVYEIVYCEGSFANRGGVSIR
jgi:hypothetical protein